MFQIRDFPNLLEIVNHNTWKSVWSQIAMYSKIIFCKLFQAATRGMTVVQELAAQKNDILNITKFGISGGSKVREQICQFLHK